MNKHINLQVNLFSALRLKALATALALAAMAACSSGGSTEPAAAASPDAAEADVQVAADVQSTDVAVTKPDVAKADVAAVVVPLTLTSAAPTSGKGSGGDTVVLSGTGFVDGMQVLVGGTPIAPDSIFVLNDKQLQFKTPPHETGLVDLAVIAPGDPPPSANLPKAYLYFNDLVITKVDPPEGPVGGGTPITIKGSGFIGNTIVLIGGKPAIGVAVVADDEINAITPPGVFGFAPVHVVNERGAGLQKKGFFYFAAPTVAGLDPAAGPTAGGSQVIVSGTGFTKETEIALGQSKASVLEVLSDKKLKIATPPGAAGKVDVTATTKYGNGTLPGGYVYNDDQGKAATQILSIAPASGPLAGGQQVALIANGLVSASDTTILFGNKSAQILSVSATSHTAFVLAPKASAAGAVDVQLLTSKGSDKAAGGYTYVDSLSITSVTPSAGVPEGNTKITIKGAGFSKAKVGVKIGALPAAAVVVVSDSEIQAVTPPGSPGYVDVAVISDGNVAVLKNGFSYSGNKLQIYVPYPNTGAQAGGTYVHIYGNGFAPTMNVTFGGQPATHFTYLDPSHVTCKTPPGKVGAVDVSVLVGADKATLVNGYTYFNPMNAYGGTWGAEIDGSLNITVLNGKDNTPVADAFCMLWIDPTTPYQGYTNADGQITFSGDDIKGKQMVSASKTGYESASVVLFDATNVTLHMTPTPPPSPGAPPPGITPPKISGHVIGLDKYVAIPVGSCNSPQGGKKGPGDATCSPCGSDANCAGAGFACIDIGENNGKRCALDCSADNSICPSQFKCQFYADGPARCVPAKGELAAVCYHTMPTILSAADKPNEGQGFVADMSNDFSYEINSPFGEVAVVCFGGIREFGAQLVAGDGNSMLKFTPTIMGVRRHLMGEPKKDLKGVDVKLTMPLTQKAAIRLDSPPVWSTGSPNAVIVNIAQAALVFGSEGVINMPKNDVKFAVGDQNPDLMSIDALPANFSGDFADTSLSLLGFVLQYDFATKGQIPYSITIKNDVIELTNDSMVRRLGNGDFEAIDTGVKKNVYGMWGTGKDNLYAVGAQGSLVHWDGGGWTVQANFATGDLHDVYGLDKSHVWAVGWLGAAGYFDGSKWTATPFVGAPINMNGVYAVADPVMGAATGGKAVWAASQQGICQLGAAGWAKFNPSPYTNYLGIGGSDKDHIWAVGMYGAIAMWNGAAWKSQTSGTSIALRSVWAANATHVYAVGEKGQILKYDGVTWKPMSSPVGTTLTSVRGTSADDVWAVGARGVVVHWNGKVWSKVEVKQVDKALNAVWVGADGAFFSLGEQELLLGPMIYPPLANTPKATVPGQAATLIGNKIKWDVDTDTTEPHFNYIMIGIPGMGPDTPVWHLMTKGSISEVDLPDFPSIQGTPGIPKGKMLRLTIFRGYKEGFNIDAYEETDLYQLTWRSWSVNEMFFKYQ